MICLMFDWSSCLFMFVMFRLKLDIGQSGGCQVRLTVRLCAVSPPELTAPGYSGRHEGWRLAVTLGVRGTVGRNVRQHGVQGGQSLRRNTSRVLTTSFQLQVGPGPVQVTVEARVTDVVHHVVIEERVERWVLRVRRWQIVSNGASSDLALALAHGRFPSSKLFYLVFCFGHSLHGGARSCNCGSLYYSSPPHH